ncbi:class C sortase [Miniphocaeibacter massiliensis]|uniref:class C sortase n=1 Tax=Miniphocaeibacter massiliensis TaxID=2041841 RepID=UPI000C1BF934|nr:class C sortase [Miniphocaeibacter massiliensis]
MRRILLTLSFIILGLGLIAYPQISKHIYDKNMDSEILSYEKEVTNAEKKKIEEEWEKAIIYNQNLKGNPVRDPFIEGSGRALPENYLNVLNFPNNSMGYIEIPKINIKLPIYHGTSEETLQKGIGHMEGTTLPIGGKENHSVLTGHSGLAHSKMFTDLTELKYGDLFFIKVLDETFAYKVDQIKTVLPDNLKYIELEKEDFVTLITCTPYGVNSHRLLVRGVRTEYNQKEKDSIKSYNNESEADRKLKKVIIITSIIMTILIIIALILKRFKYNKLK